MVIIKNSNVKHNGIKHRLLVQSYQQKYKVGVCKITKLSAQSDRATRVLSSLFFELFF